MATKDKMKKSPTFESVKLEGALGSFSYELTYKKVKNINIRVSGGIVRVSAPRGTPRERISRFVLENEAFVLRAVSEQTARLERKIPTSYADGGCFYYLGRARTLVLARGKSSVRLDGERLLVSLAHPEDETAVERALVEWISGETLSLVKSLCLRHLGEFAPHLRAMPALYVRAMKRRLGSCCPSRASVTFARTLACLPTECVEYVVLHELCHFIFADHSPAFYRELGARLPNHRALRRHTSEQCEVCFPSR